MSEPNEPGKSQKTVDLDPQKVEDGKDASKSVDQSPVSESFNNELHFGIIDSMIIEVGTRKPLTRTGLEKVHVAYTKKMVAANARPVDINIFRANWH